MRPARCLALFPLVALVALPAVAWTPEELWEAWPEARVVETPAPCVSPEELQGELAGLALRHPAGVRVETLGRSAQGRLISLVTVGRGERKVLLWSQMHGDEPSATPALVDLVAFLLDRPEAPASRAILGELTLLIVPMLNPDGAVAYDRRNAQAIDVNRDALELSTPEGRLLKRVRDEHEPVLGFNLHDQNRRRTVGDSGVLATNAVLAVAGDEERTVTPGRERAMRASVAIAEALAPFFPGGMARYDDSFTSRAFGDNVTRWGTPVVLIESGGLPAGRPFDDLTRTNFVALLTALEGLAHDDLAAYDMARYEEIPENEIDEWVDVAVRGGAIRQPGTTEPYSADIVFDVFRSDREWAGCAPPGPPRSRLVEIGDSRHLAAGQEVAADGRLLLPPWVAGASGWEAGAALDAPALARLARLGVGSVRWTVPEERFWAATRQAGELVAIGRARLEPVVAADGDRVTALELAAAREPASPALADVLSALFGEEAAERLLAQATDAALARLWALPRHEPEWPPLTPGRPASFLVVAPGGDGPLLREGRLESVWLGGHRADAPAAALAGIEAEATR